jgi:LacI family transcriptional regulator
MTSTELARLCNVSRATVDRVFNGRGRVNEKTRKMILETADSVGYRPNYIAQCLVTGKTRSIGLVVPSLNNSFFSMLLNAVASKAQQCGYIAIVTLYEDQPELEHECVLNLMERQVDGFILFSTSPDRRTVQALRERGIPAVAMFNAVEGLPCVSIDYRRAMADATNYVLSKGYTNLIFLCPPLQHEMDRNIYAIRQRLGGFEDALAKHEGEGIRSSVIGTADYMDIIGRMQFTREEKTAILCSSDVYALNVLRQLKTRGIHVPLDVGIMGFDGIEALAYVEPSIATVGIPIARLGECAVTYLLDCIATGGSAAQTILPHEITPGQSIV